MVDTTLNNDGWIIDADITQRDKHAYMKSVQAAQETGDETILYPFYAKIVKAWPFAGLDPQNVDHYEDLRQTQIGEVARRVIAAFQELIESVTKPVK